MRALNKMEKETKNAVKDGLKDAADPIVSDIRQRLSVYTGLSTGTIGPRVVVGGIFITQRKRKVTGKRGDFGSLQMTHGFLPATEDADDDIREAVEDEFNALAIRAGF